MSRLARTLLLSAAVALPLRGAEPPAPPLPLEDVLSAAVERAPLARAADARRDAAEASAAKARRLPNPEASVRVENWRRGSEARPFDASADLDVVAELAQPLPVFGSWSARKGEAAALARGARAVARGEREALLLEAEQKLLEAGIVEKGDLIVLTIGEPIGKSGGTNTLKIVRVGEHH